MGFFSKTCAKTHMPIVIIQNFKGTQNEIMQKL